MEKKMFKMKDILVMHNSLSGLVSKQLPTIVSIRCADVLTQFGMRVKQYNDTMQKRRIEMGTSRKGIINGEEQEIITIPLEKQKDFMAEQEKLDEEEFEISYRPILLADLGSSEQVKNIEGSCFVGLTGWLINEKPKEIPVDPLKEEAPITN